MQGNRSSDTRPEVALRSALHRRGLRFFKNKRPLAEIRCRADIVFPAARVVVFVDGCFWHRCPKHGVSPSVNVKYWAAKLDRNVARDRRNDRALREAGWHVIRVWEHECVDEAADHVAAAVDARGRLL
jgi:DNA mismatch endonuclease, patch repair protein